MDYCSRLEGVDFGFIGVGMCKWLELLGVFGGDRMGWEGREME